MTATSLWNFLPLGARVRLFRFFEAAANFRNPPAASEGSPLERGRARQPSLWIFASTIGELNATEPFINRLLDAMGQPELTLISDRQHYGDAYRAKFPHAHLEILSGAWPEVRSLMLRCPPLMLVIAEIPCLLHDAPCRFSYATVRAVRTAGAPTVLVNGWLYGYPPPSRMDLVENRLFAHAYLDAFDLMLVQTDEVRDRLIAHGAESGRVVTTGNIKFDAMLRAYAAPLSSPLRDALRQRRRGPIIVAGSVTRADAVAGVVAGFAHLLARAPGALLVLAPRHPEDRPSMEVIERELRQAGLAYRLRSQHGPEEAVAGPVLVLDTIGELRASYAEAALAYVGTDHNILEPLAFGVPVFVSGGWEPTYPSFPVYRHLLEAGALHAVSSMDELGPAWAELLAQGQVRDEHEHARVDAVLSQARGAVDRCIDAISTRGLLDRGGAIGGSR